MVATQQINGDLLCISPPTNSEDAGHMELQVALNGQDWTEIGLIYTVFQVPSVSRLFPNSGPVQGGAFVTLVGSRFISEPVHPSHQQLPTQLLCRYRLGGQEVRVTAGAAVRATIHSTGGRDLA